MIIRARATRRANRSIRPSCFERIRMKMKSMFSVALLTLGAAVVAQTTPASPAKKELVAKLLQLQQPGIETVARGLVERPALMLMQGAGNVMQTRIPPD